jgi:simple sugar transport system permease protein
VSGGGGTDRDGSAEADAGPDGAPSTGGDGDGTARSALERLVRASAFERFLLSLAALALAILVGTVIILVSGRTTTCQASEAAYYLGVGFCYDPVAVYDRLFLGALGDPFSPGWSPLNSQLAVTLRETTVLVFTGLSVAIAFRAGIFNIGTQGQLVVGALATGLATGAVAPAVPAPFGALVVVPLGLAVGALFGGLYGAIPGALKAYAEANEVITTIMLNFIATSVAFFLVSEYFRNPNSQAVETTPLPSSALFPALVFDPRDDFSLLALALGVTLMGAASYLLARTAFGYDVRTSGLQPDAAEYGGVDAERTVVSSMALSGALGGVGGAVYVLMVLGKFQTGVPAYGFDGITVSILAGNNPLGVGAAALLFGTMKSGSTVVQFATDVPPQLVGVLRGLVILFVAMPEFFRLLGRGVLDVGDRSRPAAATDGGTPVADSTPGRDGSGGRADDGPVPEPDDGGDAAAADGRDPPTDADGGGRGE